MALAFVKVEGLGNDFVLLDRLDHSAAQVSAEVEHLQTRAESLCDRHVGIGADGILVVGPAKGCDGAMWVVNHDGSRPEMCGNGLRCVAAHLAHRLGRDELVVQTDAGPKPCQVERHDDQIEVNVDMGPGEDLGVPDIAASARPFRWVSMGNPHAITFVAPGDDPEALARREGPAVERDAAFPDRTNVEYAQLQSDGSLTLWVWERGVGITLACGTGACAAACAAVWQGLAPANKALPIDLPGGRLWITVPEQPSAGVMMRGPARVVFEGTL